MIGIIGGGIAGNALAQMLAQKNIASTIFEKVENPKPVGSGIMLQLPALTILDKLGLGQNIINNGSPLYGLKGKNGQGKTVLEFDFTKLDPKFAGLGTHRGSIFSNLLEQSIKNPLIDLKLGQEITSIQNLENKVIVKNQFGESFDFEILIIANGSGSKLRELFPKILKQSKVQSYSALWTTMDYEQGEFMGKISHTYQNSKHLYGMMPIGFATNQHLGKHQINFFCSVPFSINENWNKENFEKWKKESYKLAPNLHQFINQITEIEQLTFTPYFDARLNPFFENRVVFVGDACHAISPHLSAGINLALMDVYTLANCLETEKNHSVAFQKYFEMRKSQIRYYYWISRIVTPMFQSEVNIGWLRNSLIPLLYKIPVTQKMLLDTICGVSNGCFSRIDKEFL